MHYEKRVSFLEYNVIKKNWKRSKLKIALCYPNTYKAGMTGLTVQQLYYLFNLDEEVLCERCFLSEHPKTIESHAELKAFDVIAFTLQYEEDYINMIKMLMNANINPLAEKRSESDPLIIAGGQAVSANPLPLSKIVDCVFVGELEPELFNLLEILKERKSKKSKLNELCGLDCIYYPGKNRVKRSIARNLNEIPHILAQLTPSSDDAFIDPIFANAFYLEISRSCNRRCRFCLLSWTNGPFRYRSFSKAKELLEAGLQRSKGERVVLLGAGISDVPWLKDICKEVITRGLKLSIPSLRPDVVDAELLELVKEGGQKSLALGVESLSNENRAFLGKPYDDTIIEDIFQMAVDKGLAEVKLYLITCLPKENINEAVPLLQRIIKILSKSNTSLHISINPLIPKPNTPFQWLPPPKPTTIKNHYKQYAKLFKHPRIKVDFLNPYRATSQALLSLGDEAFGPCLINLAKRPLTTWSIMVKVLSKIFRKVEIENPWDVIDVGYDKKILRKSFEKAMQVIK
ncbi:MAG: radical SAM protein [Candidatus Nezhaarchaeales archaeon]